MSRAAFLLSLTAVNSTLRTAGDTFDFGSCPTGVQLRRLRKPSHAALLSSPPFSRGASTCLISSRLQPRAAEPAKHRPHRPRRFTNRRKTRKTGYYCAVDTRLLRAILVDEIYRVKCLQTRALRAVRSMRLMFCRVLCIGRMSRVHFFENLIGEESQDLFKAGLKGC